MSLSYVPMPTTLEEAIEQLQCAAELATIAAEIVAVRREQVEKLSRGRRGTLAVVGGTDFARVRA
jgi:hypothetical protein